MSINIMDLVKGAVSDQVMGQLGGLLGQTDNQKTSSIFGSAAASILGGLLNKSQSPQGVQQVFEAASQADDSILDRLGDLLGGGDQTQQIEQQGSGVLDMVFGNQRNGIVETLSRALGLDGTMIGKLLTMAAPILMGVIGRQIKSKALDMAGFGSMLSDQKQHLGSYLPAGLGSELGLGNLADSTPAASPATHASEAGGGSIAKILIPLLLLGALAYGAFKIMGNDNGAQEAMDEDVPALDIDSDFSLDIGDAVAGTVGGMNLGEGLNFDALGGEAAEKLKGLQGQFTDIASGFEGLSTEDGANVLKDKIQGLTGTVGDLGLGDLGGVAKTSASTMIGKFVEMIRGMVDQVENPALKGILQPAVDGLLSKLESLNL